MTAPVQQGDACCGSSTSMRRTLITGGSGYLGFRLASMLAKQGVEVDLLDIAPPQHPLPPGVRFFPGSVADASAVDTAYIGASLEPSSSARLPLDAVFHVASYGMSGRELRDRAKIMSVNVGGTRNMISACLRHRVPRLVYVSTCNTIFVGKPIVGGDESAPYPPPSAYKDAYSATKAQAERLVLEANGLPLQPAAQDASSGATRPAAAAVDGDDDATKNGGHLPATCSTSPCRGPAGTALAGRAGPDEQCQPSDGQLANGCGSGGSGGRLYTCCIRSTGIWGPGETRHQPRVIRMVRAGLFQATFGEPDSLSDWIHVDNLVQIMILAERALRLPDPGAGGQQLAATSVGDADGDLVPRRLIPVAAGQVYYASDGEPINNFLHFKPFIVGLGYHYPSMNVPFALVYGIASLIEYAWPLLSHLVADPPLTRMEVDKCCITHWFKIDKARRELGFKPLQYDRAEVVRHMAAEGWAAADKGARAGESKSGVVSGAASGGGASSLGARRRGLMGMDAFTLLAVVAAVAALLLAAAYGAGGTRVLFQQ